MYVTRDMLFKDPIASLIRDQNAISEGKNHSSRFDVLIAKNLVPLARYRTFWKLSSKHLKSRIPLPVSVDYRG